MSESYEQAYVKNGVLVLNAEKIDGVYKAGGIKTEGKFDFTFGKVEVRARLTRYPNGAFPAIWMMPKQSIYKGWPFCGEIDIMEHIREENSIHQTLHTHYTYDLGNKTGTTCQTVCDFTEFTVYGVEWTPEKLTFYVNGEETFSYSNMNLANESEMMQWPFTKDAAFYLILNMGLGEDASWAGAVDDNHLPATMEVDWVKVTKLEEQIWESETEVLSVYAVPIMRRRNFNTPSHIYFSPSQNLFPPSRIFVFSWGTFESPCNDGH